MSNTIREPNDWQVGDRAYVHDPDDDWSKGDIFTVRRIDIPFIYKGDDNVKAQNGIRAGRCYRILTTDEYQALQPGDRIIDLRSVSINGEFGQRKREIHTTYRDAILQKDHERYLLVHLAERKPSEQQQALDDLEAAREALARAEQRVREMSV